MTVQETYAAHINVTVAGLLHVVTGQDAQTARVNLEHMGQTVLHAEVSHRRTLCIGLYIYVFAVFVVYGIHLVQKKLILGQFLQLVIAQALEHHDRIVTNLFPHIGVDILEQSLSVLVPYPPNVVSQLVKFLQSLRYT